MSIKIEVKKRHLILVFLLVFVSIVIGYGTTSPVQFGHTATETHVRLANGSMMDLQTWIDNSPSGPKANQFVSATNLVESDKKLFVDVPGMVINVATGNRPVFILASIGGITNTLTGGTVELKLLVDGTQKSFQWAKIPAGGHGEHVTLVSFETLSAGNHEVKVQYRAGASGGKAKISLNNAQRSLSVMER